MDYFAYLIGVVLLVCAFAISDHYKVQGSIDCVKAGGAFVDGACRAAKPASGAK